MPNPLYLGFSRSTGGLFSRALGAAIRWFEKAGPADPNHAFLLELDPELGPLTLGANANGVTPMPLPRFLESRVITDVFMPAADPLALWKGVHALRADIDVPYDIRGLASMIQVEIEERWLHRDPTTVRNWLDNHAELFCSEWCLRVVRESGFAVLPRVAADVVDPVMLRDVVRVRPDFVRVELSGLMKGR